MAIAAVTIGPVADSTTRSNGLESLLLIFVIMPVMEVEMWEYLTLKIFSTSIFKPVLFEQQS